MYCRLTCRPRGVRPYGAEAGDTGRAVKFFRVKTSTQAPRTSKSHILNCEPLPLEPNGRRIDFAAAANLGVLPVSLWNPVLPSGIVFLMLSAD
jgi:hypothetical protein